MVPSPQRELVDNNAIRRKSSENVLENLLISPMQNKE
jgi:hypothetical protein